MKLISPSCVGTKQHFGPSGFCCTHASSSNFSHFIFSSFFSNNRLFNSLDGIYRHSALVARRRTTSPGFNPVAPQLHHFLLSFRLGRCSSHCKDSFCLIALCLRWQHFFKIGDNAVLSIRGGFRGNGRNTAAATSSGVCLGHALTFPLCRFPRDSSPLLRPHPTAPPLPSTASL